jgi:predicted house-cleaning NTP pyrophosphatase (Maf/HAM1 superfamily)
MKIGSGAKIILASTSVIRHKILQEAGLSFDAMSPDFDEEKAKKKVPAKIIKKFGDFFWQKAKHFQSARSSQVPM